MNERLFYSWFYSSSRWDKNASTGDHDPHAMLVSQFRKPSLRSRLTSSNARCYSSLALSHASLGDESGMTPSTIQHPAMSESSACRDSSQS